MKIGNIIREYRLNNSLSMQEFADKCNLSKGYISMLEKGKHPQNNKEIVPSIETVQKIASAMNLSVDALLEMIDKEEAEIDHEFMNAIRKFLVNHFHGKE